VEEREHTPERKIIHVDADSFYASIEMRDDPALRDKPIAVGGRTGRGVIATSNYIARQYGVRSAMPSARARVLCPQLIILKPRFELYREVSRQLRAIFHRYTALVEPLSLDEAYLDVSDCDVHSGSATLIANAIRDSARSELGITVSAGVAPNKFLAKVASDWNKPDGTFTVAPADVDTFVHSLAVSKIMGVGKVTAARLEELGVVTCGDLQAIDIHTLSKRFGKYGPRLADLARGIDHRPVRTDRIRKSISVERTFAQDVPDAHAGQAELSALLEELARRFSAIERDYVPTKRFVKLKFRDFTQTTLEESIPPDGQPWLTEQTFTRLLTRAWERGERPCRLLGAGLRLEPRASGGEQQLTLFP
jgi:DNA polymerase-4